MYIMYIKIKKKSENPFSDLLISSVIKQREGLTTGSHVKLGFSFIRFITEWTRVKGSGHSVTSFTYLHCPFV